MAPELVRIRSKSARYHVHPSQDVWGMGIVIYAVLFNDLPWEKALLTDPDYKEVEESGGVASSVANFGSLSAAMRTLLAEMLCSDYMRRCPVSELVDFLAERRAWFTSEEVSDTSLFPFTLSACGPLDQQGRLLNECAPFSRM
jgi:serine/threonine protein kinase